jgi:hypothetical protein
MPFKGAASLFTTDSWNISPPPTHNKVSTRSSWGTEANFQGRQVTTSEYHPNWKRQLGARQDVGGPFHTLKQWVEVPGLPGQGVPSTHIRAEKVFSSLAWAQYNYYGPVVVDALNSVTFPPSAESSDSVLNAWAAKQIESMKPTNSVANLSTTLLELYREGLPKLVGSALWHKRTKDVNDKLAAGEFLNYEFSWLPLVDEVTNVAIVVSSAEKLLRQFNRDSGRVVRRRRDAVPEIERSDTVFKNDVPGPWLLASSAEFYTFPTLRGKVVRSRVSSRRRWISAAFTYRSNMLDMDSANPPRDLNILMGAAEKANHLLGLDLTPETLYNITPWSWAVDWVSSLGSVISNLEDYQQYGLVMPYGYAMEHTCVTDTYHWIGPTSLKGGYKPTPIRFTTEVKKRVRANPYGFGLTWAALNGTQQAILAALGITRRG